MLEWATRKLKRPRMRIPSTRATAYTRALRHRPRSERYGAKTGPEAPGTAGNRPIRLQRATASTAQPEIRIAREGDGHLRGAEGSGSQLLSKDVPENHAATRRSRRSHALIGSPCCPAAREVPRHSRRPCMSR